MSYFRSASLTTMFIKTIILNKQQLSAQYHVMSLILALFRALYAEQTSPTAVFIDPCLEGWAAPTWRRFYTWNKWTQSWEIESQSETIIPWHDVSQVIPTMNFNTQLTANTLSPSTVSSPLENCEKNNYKFGQFFREFSVLAYI